MEALIFYFAKVIICSGVMFLYYQLSLRDKTFHHYNRFYLLFAMLISILLPLVNVEDFTIEVNNDIYLLINKIQNLNTTKNLDHDYTYFKIILSALGLVSIYFLGKLLYGIFRIQRLKSEFKKESFEGVNFYQTNLSEAPFSYFRNLFWKNTIMVNSDIGKQILKHEMVHIEQKHSVDKIFIEIITSVFWFNPFFHIIKKEISLIHEYLADKKAVKKSDTKAFAQMLLASHFSGNPLPATSPFLSSNLKKRLKMLQKPKTKFGYARRIFALPVLFTVAFAYMVNAKNKEIKETNNEIEKAVSQIRKDTVPEKSQKKLAVIELQSAKKIEESKKISQLSKKLEEKSKTLQNLQPESKDFEKNVEEIAKLSEEIARISSSEDFLNSGRIIRMNGKEMTMNDFFKSEDWKNNVRELQNMKFEIPDMSEFSFDFSIPPTPPTPPKAPKVKVYTFKNLPDMQWSPELEAARSSKKAKESASTARKRAEIERKRAKLMEKRAKLDAERAKLEAERRALDGNRMKVLSYGKTFTMPKQNIIMQLSDDTNYTGSGLNRIYINGKDASAEEIKYYIDGKEVGKIDLKDMDPKNIESMKVMKNTVNGKKQGEIYIKTKKSSDIK